VLLFFPVIPVFFSSPLSFPCLARESKKRCPGVNSQQSRDPRNALRLSEDDRRKNNTVIPVLLFFPVVPVPSISFVIPWLDRGICKGDPRVKPEDDKEKNALSFERAGSNYSLVIWDIFSLMTAGVYFSTLLSTLREASFSLTLLLSSSPESSSRIRA
jgi:hypothetical protein